MYDLFLNGTHVASFRHFGDANRAAFDDLPGFDPLECSWLARARTEVKRDGKDLAAYELQRGRLARVIDTSRYSD